MGVYHVMGLGKSPGAVTSVLHYLVDRLNQYLNDKGFFSQSGEWNQKTEWRSKGTIRPPGYLQGLILMTTPEIKLNKEKLREPIEGKSNILDIVRNELVKLKKHNKSCFNDSFEFSVCTTPYKDFDTAYERSLLILNALGPSGKTGKEVWLNLTAGDNALVMALHLASAYTGRVARWYCTNVDKDRERELRHPVLKSDLGLEGEDKFWTDLPVVVIQNHEVRLCILELLEKEGKAIEDEELCSRLKNMGKPELSDLDVQSLRRNYLHSMESQKLTERAGEHSVKIGPMWCRVKKYYEMANQATENLALNKLCEKYEWADHEIL